MGALFFWKEDVIYDKQIAGVPNKYPYHEQVIQNPNGSNIDSYTPPQFVEIYILVRINSEIYYVEERLHA